MKLLKLAVVAFAALALPATGKSQTYTQAFPFESGFFINADDTNGTGGSTYEDFDTLSETATIDSADGTIEQAGSLPGTTSPVTFSFVDTETTTIASPPPVFPNPPAPPQTVTLTGTITITLTPVNLTGISFDTGPQSVTYSAANGGYTFDGDISPVGDFLGSWSLITGGVTYSGTFGMFENANSYSLFNTVFTNDYPDSISFANESPDGPLYPLGSTEYQNDAPIDVVASNGFDMNLNVGANLSNIPEPDILSLLSLGVIGIIAWRRYKC